MTRPVFVPVFEEDESVILNRTLARLPEIWRKEPGDFVYDTVATSPLEIKQLEINQDYVLKSGFAQYAEGSDLDAALAGRGLERYPATPNKRALQILADAGVVIPTGKRLSVVILDNNGNTLEYTVDSTVTYAVSGTMDVAITCSQVGVIGNVVTGSQFIIIPPIPGVRSITDTGTTELGTDAETDAAAWERYDFTVKNPDTGGNKNDYVRWATDITGVGKAKCIPRWDGVNTVKVIIVGTDFTPALTALVDEVQLKLDPDSAGLGEGKAPCGAAVTVVAADNLVIGITATVTYAGDPVTTGASFIVAVAAYLASLVFVDSSSIVWARIGAILITTPGVSNYTDLIINGGTADITVGDAAPTVGTVII